MCFLLWFSVYARPLSPSLSRLGRVQGGLVQQMLAHRAWVPLARLSFGAYLLHPLIINLWFLNATTKVGGCSLKTELNERCCWLFFVECWCIGGSINTTTKRCVHRMLVAFPSWLVTVLFPYPEVVLVWGLG